MSSQYAVLVVQPNGKMKYLREGSGIALFNSMYKALAHKDFLLQGMADEVQTISAVLYEPESQSETTKKLVDTLEATLSALKHVADGASYSPWLALVVSQAELVLSRNSSPTN